MHEEQNLQNEHASEIDPIVLADEETGIFTLAESDDESQDAECLWIFF